MPRTTLVIGVLLAFVSRMVLVEVSNGFAMQIALSVGGIMVMIASATLLNLISVKPRPQPAGSGTLLSENQATTMVSQSARR